jgi:hypothetical protein
MARLSSVKGVGVKLENGDKVRVFGINAEVEDVTILPAFGTVPASVLIAARVNHAETPNFFNLSEIEAVSFKGKWANLKGEPVTV